MTGIDSSPAVVCTPEEVTAEWLSAALGTEVRSARTEATTFGTTPTVFFRASRPFSISSTSACGSSLTHLWE